MSVEEIAGLNRQFFNGDGSEDEFTFTFQVLESTDVKAYVSGVLVAAVTIVLDEDGEGGVATFDSPPAAGSGNVMLIGLEPIEQPTEFTALSNFPETSIEAGLDRMALIARQLKEALKRALKSPIESLEVDLFLPAPDAGKPIKWNAGGTGFENGDRDLDDIVDDAEAAEAAAVVAKLAAQAAQTAAVAAQTAAETALASTVALAPYVSGTRAAPNSLVAGTAFIPNAHYMQTAFIQGSGAPVAVSANPQIAAGSVVGQLLKLVGRSDANTVTYANGTGLALNGDCTLGEDNVLEVEWDGTNWRENSRSH